MWLPYMHAEGSCFKNHWIWCIYSQWKQAFVWMSAKNSFKEDYLNFQPCNIGKNCSSLIVLMEHNTTASTVLWRWKAKCYEAALIGPLNQVPQCHTRVSFSLMDKDETKIQFVLCYYGLKRWNTYNGNGVKVWLWTRLEDFQVDF